MPKKRDINKVKAFAKTYIDNNLDSTKAMREISPNLEPNALHVKKNRWMSSIEVINEITAYIASLNITPNISKDLIRARLIKILTDTDSKDSDAIQAGSVLGRLEGVSNEGGMQVNIIDLKDLKTQLKQANVNDNTKVSQAQIIDITSQKVDTPTQETKLNNGVVPP